MKLEKIKTVAEVLAAIKANPEGRDLIEITTVDKTLKGIRVGGAHFTVDTYSFQMHRESTGEVEERFRLTANIAGFPPVVSYHGSDYEANNAASPLPSIAEIEVVPVRVLVDDAGEVIREVDGESAAPAARDTSDDLPF